MRVAVVGAGAVGSLLGGVLAQAGHEVTLVRRRHAGPPGPSTLAIRRPDGSQHSVPVTVVAEAAAAATPELIVLAVKMPDLAAAISACDGWPGATV
ncbi:MAG TPA: 2-dehydropantoate 2-reductase N-terminal domain-containing protein, partial [Candidatus Limnocylindrales bacterium]|nr:2-dehydropantoate 2-reductase N-terminal domain-containing protein [Candidatus Limnocylindrales bacterium]